MYKRNFKPFDCQSIRDIWNDHKLLATTSNHVDPVEKIPKEIVGTYSEDFDILKVDSIIKLKLSREKLTVLPQLEAKKRELEQILTKPQRILDKNITTSNLNTTNQEIQDIKTESKLAKYLALTANILEAYKKCKTAVKTIPFGVESDNDPEPDEATTVRINIIEQYLAIASNYIKVDVVRKLRRLDSICPGCGKILNPDLLLELTIQYCPSCGTEINIVVLTKTGKDHSRVNLNFLPEDDSIENFLRAFTRYQGLQLENPPLTLYQELDSYFSSRGRPSGAAIRALPLNSRGRRGDTTHKMLWSALSNINRSTYYEFTNKIGHEYWGWQLPQVAKYKERIILHYQKTQRVFLQIPAEERCRESSLGTQYRLWRHLQLVGHECFMDEFKIADNPESLRTHHRLWKRMCEGANDPDIYYIP